MATPDHLTCFLSKLYAGQEATVRTRHGTTDWLGKSAPAPPPSHNTHTHPTPTSHPVAINATNVT